LNDDMIGNAWIRGCFGSDLSRQEWIFTYDPGK